MSKEWFILQFKPNAHFVAKKNLNHQGFETFLPLNDTSSRKKSRFVNIIRPLFPGYMFIKFDSVNTRFSKINNTPGVSRLVTFNSILKSIPSEVINNLIERCDLSGKLITTKEIKIGSRVKVLKGPFASFIATVEDYENDQRMWILMEIMGRKTKIQAPSVALQAAN